MDRFLITFYRFTGYPLLDYFIGTAILAFLCVAAGELSISLALRFNRRHLNFISAEIKEKERLSREAHRAGDRESYRALNREATDAWGKQFFTMAAYSAGILWPMPFALAWMQSRFHEIEFPLAFPLSLLFGNTVGYLFTFIPLYVLARILFKYLKPRLPYCNRVNPLPDHPSA